jgi:hypothetical protein
MDVAEESRQQMSIEAVALVLNKSKAQGRAKLVLIGIANHLGDHGAWPSIATLARYANASERSVKRDIQELVALGELKVELQAAPINKQYKTNLYWITLAGVTDEVSRGDNSGNSGVTPIGTQTINRNLKEPIYKFSKISDDFSVTEEMQSWLKDKGFALDIKEQTELFIGHYQATGKVMKDWSAAWRNWMIKASKWSKPVWDLAKEQNAIESKNKLEKDKELTVALIAEMRESDKKSTPSPKCQHGKSIALCKPCIKALN